MKISIVQYDIKWEDKLSNYRSVENLISGLENKTDLVILPEMFTTGFSMNPEKLYEKPLSGTHKWMANMAAIGNFGMCGSFIAGENGSFYNRWILVTPDGKTWSYDKRHLFQMTGEEIAFTPGNRRELITFREFRICPNVCYDLRFPVWSRNKNDYDLLINSANWPDARREVWITLLKARAIENQCYVAGSNRIGTDGAGIYYRGDSMIINPKGEIIALAEENKECVITSDISMKELSDFREKFPVLNDADDFTLNI
jgi:omega-amidase